MRGRKLVVQIVETFQSGGVPAFVESLDAVRSASQAGMPIAPVMIYGDDVSHVVTEEGIAYLYKAQARRSARGARGDRRRDADRPAAPMRERSAQLRARGIVAYPEDLGVRRTDASRTLLAARSIEDLVRLVGRPVQAAGPLSQLVSAPWIASAVIAVTAAHWRAAAACAGQARARELAERAVQALVAEAMLTPKPALVDQRGPGAHDDLDLERLLRSAHSLRGSFHSMALQARGAAAGP